jgi:hypothetical protein
MEVTKPAYYELKKEKQRKCLRSDPDDRARLEFICEEMAIMIKSDKPKFLELYWYLRSYLKIETVLSNDRWSDNMFAKCSKCNDEMFYDSKIHKLGALHYCESCKIKNREALKNTLFNIKTHV